jgi:hypothetical protein
MNRASHWTIWTHPNHCQYVIAEAVDTSAEDQRAEQKSPAERMGEKEEMARERPPGKEAVEE